MQGSNQIGDEIYVENLPRLRIWMRIRILFGRWVRIRTRVKIGFRSFEGSKWKRGGPRTLTMETWRLKMEDL
jgi:hypothetical protein